MFRNFPVKATVNKNCYFLHLALLKNKRLCNLDASPILGGLFITSLFNHS